MCPRAELPAGNHLKPSPAKLKKAFLQDLTDAWQSFRATHPDETPYAFVLYGLEGALLPQLHPVVLTQESLTRVAQRYVDKGHYDTLEESRKALRYSIADSPHFAKQPQTLPTVDALLAPSVELDETEGYELLAKAAMAAFADLDKQELFGAGKAREQILLMVTTDGTEKDWSLPSAKKINPPAVFQRYQDETKIEGTFASCDSFALTSDAKILFACITRKNPDYKPGGPNEFLREISAFTCQSPRLTKIWTHVQPERTVPQIVACTPDGTQLLALQSRRGNGPCQCLLLRLDPKTGNEISRTEFPGEPAELAIAHDGSRAAVGTHDSTLRVFDSAFQTLFEKKLEGKPKGLHFLTTGELLIAADDHGVLKLDATLNAPTKSIPTKAFALSVDAAESSICVSRWFFTTGLNRDPNPFGVKLFPLKSQHPPAEFIVPGYQCVNATLSPDAKLLALDARQVDTPRKLIVVFDVATGREVARRKSPSLKKLSFLPDNRTLAIAFAGHVTGEPINFWSWE